jgi:alkanesulfonate monooxygenase SsuD/methylene tetrahydromethanopterin reductase-like flavin-dependent oxidoreductase (luciferase family)
VQVLERHCEAEKRDPATIRRSMMAFAVVGPDTHSLDVATGAVMRMFGGGRPASGEAHDSATLAAFRETLKARGMIVGTTGEVLDILGRYAALGLQEIQFQHFNFDDDAVPEYLAAEIAPRAKGL